MLAHIIIYVCVCGGLYQRDLQAANRRWWLEAAWTHILIWSMSNVSLGELLANGTTLLDEAFLEVLFFLSTFIRVAFIALTENVQMNMRPSRF